MTIPFDAERETKRIASFISRLVDESSAHGAVVALSGGVDSAVVGALCVRALGRERVLALLMPSDHTPREDTSDARGLAEAWRVKWQTTPVSEAVGSILRSAKVDGTRVAKGNLEARVRMTLLYYHANSMGYLVAGTGDRSEALLGYFTKWGDGGVDFLPIAHLFKTQVRELGDYLGLPTAVVKKPASPQLWPGQSALDEIPADYSKLDVALYCIFDRGSTLGEAARQAGLPVEIVRKALKMHEASEHKRNLPPSLA